MKNICVLFVFAIVFCSCSTYQDALKSDDIKLKYTLADSLYQGGSYKKALKLYEQIVPLYRGRPQAERVMYAYSDIYYQLGDYYLAGYQFERFVKSYPQSTKREEAAFKSAESYYQLSPSYYLDQADTYKAMEKLQEYINVYPDSERQEQANAMVKELQTKLEKKDFEIAKGYNTIGASRNTFPNAIKAFDNFISAYPGSVYREDAMFWRFDSAYQFAVGSRLDLMTERLIEAKEAYEVLEKYYPSGKYTEEVTEMIEDINERLQVEETIN
ncbi:outer membrane protein assembly factor BamD [uncultured Dokdonia sp.]|uniref:outer membrane protein assembly factor BamD n=1 Tax=uncultured Dokdonia sp. TaxID=575653 RepID=UPI0026290032|nr:outer membrane protein assembly factor BamD [uncultured Dokdonia sp.]